MEQKDRFSEVRRGTLSHSQPTSNHACYGLGPLAPMRAKIRVVMVNMMVNMMVKVMVKVVVDRSHFFIFVATPERVQGYVFIYDYKSSSLYCARAKRSFKSAMLSIVD